MFYTTELVYPKSFVLNWPKQPTAKILPCQFKTSAKKIKLVYELTKCIKALFCLSWHQVGQISPEEHFDEDSLYLYRLWSAFPCLGMKMLVRLASAQLWQIAIEAQWISSLSRQKPKRPIWTALAKLENENIDFLNNRLSSWFKFNFNHDATDTVGTCSTSTKNSF